MWVLSRRHSHVIAGDESKSMPVIDSQCEFHTEPASLYL